MGPLSPADKHGSPVLCVQAQRGHLHAQQPPCVLHDGRQGRPEVREGQNLPADFIQRLRFMLPPSLFGEGRLEMIAHRIKGVGQPAEFIMTLHLDRGLEISAGDALRGAYEEPQGPHHRARVPPRKQERKEQGGCSDQQGPVPCLDDWREGLCFSLPHTDPPPRLGQRGKGHDVVSNHLPPMIDHSGATDRC